MRIALTLLAVAAMASLTGCAGPEKKFGRGMNNLTEIIRGGEMSRAQEQTALWDGPDQGRTVGFARGFTRTMARTGIGLYEVVTFPLPPYGPVFTPKSKLYPDPSVKTLSDSWGGLRLPEKPVYSDSYKPGWASGSIFDTDTYMGFSGGDIMPVFPGSRFTVLGPSLP